MILCRVTGTVWSTQKNAHLAGHRLLLCQPVALDGETGEGTSFVAVDRVDAGEGDLVLVNAEGGGARLVLNDDLAPLRNLVVAVVDAIDVDGEPTR